MKSRLQLKFIRTVTVSVLVIFLLSAAAVVFFWGRDTRARLIEDERERMKISTSRVAEMQTSVYNMALTLIVNDTVQNFVRNSGEKISDFLARRNEVRQILNAHSHILDYVREIMIYTKDEHTLTSMSVRENFVPEKNEWYTRFKDTGKWTGYTVAHPDSGSNFFQRNVVSYVISYRDYHNPDTEMGDLLIDVDTDFLRKAMQVETSYRDGYCLFDSEGNAIVQGGQWELPYEQLSDGSDGCVILTENGMLDGWTLAVSLSNGVLWRHAGIGALLLLCVLAALLLVLIPVLLFVSRKILSPIRQLTEEAIEVGKGNFDVAVDIHTDDELEVLSEVFQEMIRNIQKLMNEAVENEKLTRRIQIDRLMLQINPHFIYNTLNSIVYMAKMNHNPEIADFSSAFISLLQSTLRERNSIYISLKEELTNVRNYLKLQEYRYADKFQTEISCPEELLDAAIPNVMLQPVVENAIFHGIAPKDGRGNLWIRIVREGNCLQITVEDDGIGMTDEMLRRLMTTEEQVDTGGIRRIGVANVSRRIREIYGDAYGMTIVSRYGEGTRVSARIPYMKYSD